MYHNYIILTRDLFPFTLSIPPTGQPVVLYIGTLSWQFYNSKSFILNGAVSPFGKITIRFLLQWLQDLVLDGALTSILQPIPLGNKMSLPAKAQSKDSTPGAMRLLPRLLSLQRLLLHLLFLPLLRISSPNLWKCLWRQRRLRLRH